MVFEAYCPEGRVGGFLVRRLRRQVLAPMEERGLSHLRDGFGSNPQYQEAGSRQGKRKLTMADYVIVF